MMSTIDLFSGCGGMSLGFKMAGFRSLLASDIDENCEKTFVSNFPGTPFIRKDISEIRKEDVDAVPVLLAKAIAENLKHQMAA